ncbi:MAG: iron ABC transporter permease [Spirochaetia bacterium]|jgi:iron(III) transport system permease protein|uniref:ABC transmembrane type-1 domain-containing protein n=1 Tax=bioreactor metagenome TaxID=1076179 RepID=A0A644UI23_9ZZZZ|nr:iron ABC transporter permease [Spirochaetia bacterium]MDD3821282.1 iron ABC transporter permease [Spirochaetales bacterium]NLX46273.1 iron ABC transporter permease [Treponema sp.]VBB40021.1 putative ABC-type Fe3+ transport system,permease component [uncultured Spirochaetota bacterium]MCE1208691.1 iron ABC transporter permease [Spirochaetia bacterium]
MNLRGKRADVWHLVTFIGFAIVIVFLIYPLFDVFQYSFKNKETGELSLANWKEFFGRAYYMRAFGHSMFIALATTFFSMVLGIPLAFFTTRYKIKGSNLLTTLSVLALLSPTFIGAYSWITMLGRNGFLRNLFSSIGITLPPIYGALGIILADSLQYYPFISLMLAGSLMTIDRSLEEASENLGARATKTFFSVTMPLVLPSLTGGALIVFMMSLSNFGTPMIIGGNYLVLPTLAYNMFTSEVGESPGMASTVSIILMLCAAVVIVLQTWASSRRKYASMLVNRPVVKKLKGAKAFLAHLVCYFIVGLSTLPLGVIVFYSFRNTSGPVFKPGFSLGSYRQIFFDVPKTVANSFIYSFVAVLLIALVGTLLGFVIARRRNLAVKLLDPLLMIPYIVPGTVLGIGFIVAFNRKPIFLTGTAIIMILTYFIRRLPYSVRSAASILKQIDPALEEAGINLGSPPGRTFRTVTLPLMQSGIISGAIMSWVTSMNELSASVLLYVGRTMTMPIKVYLSVADGYFGTASAMSTILLAVTGIAMFVVNKYFNRGSETFIAS